MNWPFSGSVWTTVLFHQKTRTTKLNSLAFRLFLGLTCHPCELSSHGYNWNLQIPTRRFSSLHGASAMNQDLCFQTDLESTQTWFIKYIFPSTWGISTTTLYSNINLTLGLYLIPVLVHCWPRRNCSRIIGMIGDKSGSTLAKVSVLTESRGRYHRAAAVRGVMIDRRWKVWNGNQI